MKILVGAVLFTFVFEKSFALRCWKCSSDIDPSCRDPFNEYNNRNYRQSSGAYDNLQQNYNQRQYDNYNTRYDTNNNNNNNQRYDNQRYDNNRDPNYNPGFSNYNSGYNNVNRAPVLEQCDENEARNKRMRHVCLKEIVRGSSYVSVVRRCELVAYEQPVGTCSQGVNRGLTLDFCEYCDWDGCNSATGLKTNVYLAAAISLIVLFFYH
ncbi:unnamed protein product [Psylliodes chrysocephalus]|uniref:Protein sleepless n=1 Tax=Psylliodes chrysocephalus TaxID=3402493 RepID=A0A9P0CVE4_9CUCU|nr:unnamed protein product [Psylliodes chrysocephala]